MSPAVRLSGAAALLALGLGACESTQDRSAQLQKQGAKVLAAQHGLSITTVSRDVHIERTDVVTDANGTAAAVVLRNLRPNPLGTVPIAINVTGPGGKSVFRNDTPGLQPSLVSVAALPPHGVITWVNDQVTPDSRATAVKATAGAGGGGAPPALPTLKIGAPRLTNDPISGAEVVGKITNASNVAQAKLFIYVSAWRGSKLVSAGRGAIQRLNPGASAPYHVYLIGNPAGASFTVDAPPTVLR